MTSLTLIPDFSSALFYAGPAFSLALQLSNAQTAVKIYSAKSVGSLSPIPFACLFTNGLIWLYYGLLINDPVVYVPNVTGALIGLGCICSYEAMSPTTNKLIYSILVFVSILVTVLAISEQLDAIGLIGCLATVLLMGAPLATLGNVIRDKSTASLPFNPSLMSFFNSLSWTLYGYLVADDVVIWGPSAAGIVLSSLQLSLFVLFGFPKGVLSRPHSSSPLDSKA